MGNERESELGGDEPSFTDFYTDAYSSVLATVALFSSDRDAARDAADEAFVRAAAAWPRVRSMDAPKGWAIRVALNYAKKQGTRDRKRKDAERAVSVPPDHAHEPSVSHFEALIADLPDRQRQAVVLRYVGDLTQADIADLMGIRRGTVSSLLATATESLRASLERADVSDREVFP